MSMWNEQNDTNYIPEQLMAEVRAEERELISFE